MADYKYRSGYSNGKGVEEHLNAWSKESYTDDECRTVIIDADGTKRVIIGCTPLHKPGSYVTKSETIIQERFLTPAFHAAYKHSSPPSSPVKSYEYAADDHELHRPFSPVKGYGYAADDHKMRRPSTPEQGFGYVAHPDHKSHRPFSPVKGYGYAADDHKMRSPVQGFGYVAHPDHKSHRPSSSPEHDYPQEVGDFLTKVQTEASRDHPGNGVNWRLPSQQTRHNGATGYGDSGEYNNKTLYKPNGNTFQNGGHQARPIPSIWVPPPSREGQLTSATNDMETALCYLKESVRSSSPTTAAPHYPHYSTVPKQDEYRHHTTAAAKRNVRWA